MNLTSFIGAAARELSGLTAEVAKIAAGTSTVGPDRDDWRFADPVWSENGFYHRLMQLYLAGGDAVLRLPDVLDLDWTTAERLRFALSLVVDAAAPTNTLLGNPLALKTARDTRGQSLIRGAQRFVEGVRTNRGMPAQVDRSAFRVGENIGTSPGAVVFRSEVLELIQYAPSTATVRSRPMVMFPSHVNKYYVFDLHPGRSLVEHLVNHGVPFFMVSWRNPTEEHRGWGIDRYVEACLEAVDAATEITGSEDANVMAVCASGVTMTAALGYLAQKADRRINSVTLTQTLLTVDPQEPNDLLAWDALLRVGQAIRGRNGVLAGRDLRALFAWRRANRSVWRAWVNEYLLGNDPPRSEVLFWNDDQTNLPAALHDDFVHLYTTNALEEPGGMSVLGEPIDLSKVDCDAYILGAVSDHITPWKAAYRATQLFGGTPEFVLSNANHVQAFATRAGSLMDRHRVGGVLDPDPTAWMASATVRPGSWRKHWTEWLLERSGEERAAQSKLGSRRHRAMEPAPGLYVLDPS
ncbi:MAG TPA: alpha/beta fold hydrolase [Actinomycetota bacterium]|nr:alpha/beta fold hydrolase [Actinomycetota bacterium]